MHRGVQDVERSDPHIGLLGAQAARGANAQILVLVRRLEEGILDTREIAFFCEDGCLEIVRLTVAEYEAAGGAWLAGHQPAT